MPFAYGYVRVSTHRQARKGYSVTNQQDRVFSEFNGAYQDSHQWGGSYTDEGVSASKKKVLERAAGKHLHDRLKPGDIIIVTRINRICRNMKDFTKMLEYWRSMDVGFVCTDDPVDTSNRSPFGNFIVQLMGCLAELESGLTSERVSEGIAVRTQLGLPSGTHPLMYRWGRDKKLHVDKPELEAAEMFFRMRVDQEMSCREIFNWTWKNRYKRKEKPGTQRRKLNGDWNLNTINKLCELYRRYLWLTERGAVVFGREYLDATARVETPMREGGPTPPELMAGRYSLIGKEAFIRIHKSSSSNSSV